LVRAAVSGEEKSVVAPCSEMARSLRMACTTVTSGKDPQHEVLDQVAAQAEEN